LGGVDCHLLPAANLHRRTSQTSGRLYFAAAGGFNLACFPAFELLDV